MPPKRARRRTHFSARRLILFQLLIISPTRRRDMPGLLAGISGRHTARGGLRRRHAENCERAPTMPVAHFEPRRPRCSRVYIIDIAQQETECYCSFFPPRPSQHARNFRGKTTLMWRALSLRVDAGAGQPFHEPATREGCATRGEQADSGRRFRTAFSWRSPPRRTERAPADYCQPQMPTSKSRRTSTSIARLMILMMPMADLAQKFRVINTSTSGRRGIGRRTGDDGGARRDAVGL